MAIVRGPDRSIMAIVQFGILSYYYSVRRSQGFEQHTEISEKLCSHTWATFNHPISHFTPKTQTIPVADIGCISAVTLMV